MKETDEPDHAAGPIDETPPTAPDRNLALDLVRVTEAAALAAGRWIGRGDKEGADQAAVDAMRVMLDTVTMDGVVVIGEGEKDRAPMLYNGEPIGNGRPPEVDVAVDPLEGTRLTSLGQASAISVVAVAERGTMFFPGAAVYMDKIVVGPNVADGIDITAPPAENVRRVARAKGVRPEDVAVVVLDRDRHQQLIDGGYDVEQVLTTDALVAGQDVFVAATGVTTGALLRGVGYTPNGAITHSLVMRSRSGTVRRIEATHAFEKLMKFSTIAYR